MKHTFIRLSSLFLVLAMLAAALFLTTACTSGGPSETPSTSKAPVTTGPATENPSPEAKKHSFSFEVTFQDGSTFSTVIKTDKETVGEALLEMGLIAGEQSSFGLYVKTVKGETHDYDVDKTYWAFYENGNYASAGVDQTAIVDGGTYAFKVGS